MVLNLRARLAGSNKGPDFLTVVHEFEEDKCMYRATVDFKKTWISIKLYNHLCDINPDWFTPIKYAHLEAPEDDD